VFKMCLASKESARLLEKSARNILTLRFLSARSYRVVNTMLVSI